MLFAGTSFTRLPRCGAGQPCEVRCRAPPLHRRCITCRTGRKQQAATCLHATLLCRDRHQAHCWCCCLQLTCCFTTCWAVREETALRQSMRLCNKVQKRPAMLFVLCSMLGVLRDKEVNIMRMCQYGASHRVVLNIDDSIRQHQWSYFT